MLILTPVVTDLETPWQNSVVERHGALFKMAFEKACSLEAPTTEAEVNELIDFFAELNRRVGRAGISLGQRVFGRQLRLPSSLLEDDVTDPYMIAQDATHEMRDAAKRDYANGSRPWRSRRRSLGDVDGIPQPTTEATAGTSGWRTRLHTQTEGWSPRMVWSWRVRPERRTEAWTKRDSIGAHAELFAQVQSHPVEARDQRRSGRNRDRHSTAAEPD